MNRYILSVWARRLFIIILFLAAFTWSIRQISLTYKVWYPDPKPPSVVKNTPAVPESAKTMGHNFLLHWFFTKKKESLQDKQLRLKGYISPQVAKLLSENPDLMIQSSTKTSRVDVWSGKWIEPGKKALVEYQVELTDNRVMQLQLPITKSGSSWFVDGLPSLLPNPKKDPKKGQLPSFPNIQEKEQKEIKQVVDGFFDSYLSGRKDQNTKFLKNKPQDLLGIMQGQYIGVVSMQPIQKKPLIVKAVVIIRSKKISFPFEYRLVLGKGGEDQHFVKQIIGGGK